MMPLTIRASLAGLGVALSCFAAPGNCAVFNVDTTVDDAALAGCDDATPNDCSLRGAIIKANGLSEAVTINVPAGTYILSQATPCFFRGVSLGSLFTTPALCPAGNITLVGEGADTTIIDANQPPGNTFAFAPVMFVATTANVAVRGATMRRGNFTAGSTEGQGGGINNAGVLTLEDCVVSDNQTGTGGGIFNQNDLTLLRTIVTRNAAGTAGGIWNTARFDLCNDISCPGGIVTIADSTISENVAATGPGGGVVNFVGTIDVVGSAVVGNLAAGNGGGIVNFGFNTMNVTNVTVSGNRAFNYGGISNNGPFSTMHLNNVTIAHNTAQALDNPTSGSGGGLSNGAAATTTLANTIIAGNFAAGVCGINGCFPAGSDCLTDIHDGALTSLGHNLVQDTQGCDILGDTTGNITGQDPKLGVLADNGGPTSTYGVGDGSPAIDAGDPGAPGSGGSACAVTDQRGFLRPVGPRCDIGAFERSGLFSIADIVPGSGGDKGQVTAHIGGSGFVDGAAVRLRRSGQSDIVGVRTQVDVGGASIATTFDLAGAALGTWDIVVTNPDSTSTTLSGAFTVRAGVGPNVWVDVIGIIRRHGPSTIWVTYGNRGDTDAVGVPLSLSLPSGYQWGRFFDITPPPPQPGELRPDWTLVSEIVGLPGQPAFLNAPLFLPIVPVGFGGVLRLTFNLPVDATDNVMFAAAGDPVVTPQTESAFIGQAVVGAQTFATQVFGVTVPASVLSQLRQYATTQLHAMIANGQTAFATSLGTAPQIYSLDQLQMDLFFFLVPRVPPVASPSGS